MKINVIFFLVYQHHTKYFSPGTLCPGLAVLRIHMFKEVPNFALPPFQRVRREDLKMYIVVKIVVLVVN